MVRSRLLLLWLTAAGACVVQGAWAASPPAVPFAADTVHSGPQGTTRGKMFVGRHRVRTEMDQAGQQIVQIVDHERNLSWILYPEHKRYLEQRIPAGAGQAKGEDHNPCLGLPGMTCSKVGTETVNGREAEKWSMSFSAQDRTIEGTHWIDVERGFPLRSRMSDGRRTELRLVGSEVRGGREVEKWEMISSAPNQSEQRAFQWYDPKLEIAIRQEFPGGYVQELIDIEEGEQPPYLFNIPAGYQRVSLPQVGEQPEGR